MRVPLVTAASRALLQRLAAGKKKSIAERALERLDRCQTAAGSSVFAPGRDHNLAIPELAVLSSVRLSLAPCHVSAPHPRRLHDPVALCLAARLPFLTDFLPSQPLEEALRTTI